MENQVDILDGHILDRTSDMEEQQIISLQKFIFLSILSFGLYQVWWAYKAWRFYKDREKSDIMPAARAIFGIIYMIPLFDKILNFAREKGYNESYSSKGLFIGSIICAILSRLPDPFWLISTISVVFYIQPFKALNFAKQNSTDLIVVEQIGFSGRQIALIIFGFVFWALVLYGMSV